jgi:hypothetical protein
MVESVCLWFWRLFYKTVDEFSCSDINNFSQQLIQIDERYFTLDKTIYELQ